MDAANPFLPHAPIDWPLLARAVEFYRDKGYKMVEVPWAVRPEDTAITCPNPMWTGVVDGLGALVGSAEQSFLHLDLTGKLGKGMFMALTPCFRIGDDGDFLHHPYFMKLELYVNENQEMAFVKMLSHVGLFNKSELNEYELSCVHGKQMDDGSIDIELRGIEIGSYGVRRHEDHVWTYGTGIAEPRFSQARRYAE